MKTESENPNGLHQRYVVSKANGKPVDPRAVYFVLRLDEHGNDMEHVRACRVAARAYAEHAPKHLSQMAKELRNMVIEMTLGDKVCACRTGVFFAPQGHPEKARCYKCGGSPSGEDAARTIRIDYMDKVNLGIAIDKIIEDCDG